MNKKPSNIWWALVSKTPKKSRPPCIVSRARQDARMMRDSDERVIKVRVVEVK